MLTALIIVTLIFFLYITKVKTGSYNNSLSYYLIFWIGWILISFLDPFGLYSVSDQAYFLLWLNIFFFSVGYVLFCKKSSPKLYHAFYLSNKRKYALITLQLILLLIIAYYYLEFNQILADNATIDPRQLRYEQGLLFKSATELLIYNYFTTSILYISLVINIGRYVMNSKIDLSIVITLISAVLFGLTGLGRFIIFNAIIFFIIAIAFRKKFISQEKNHETVKQTNIHKKNKYLLIVLAGAGYMIIITGIRMGKVVSGGREFFDLFMATVEQGIIYFIGPFRAFDSFLNSKICDSIGHTYGISTFAGIDEIFNNFAILMGSNFTGATAKMASFTVGNIFIGQSYQFNAFYTGVMNFYLDGGVGGVIILAFLYGVVAAVVWNHYQKYPQLFSYSLLIYFTYTAIASEYRLEFGAPSTWVVIVALIMCSQWYRKKKARGVYILEKI